MEAVVAGPFSRLYLEHSFFDFQGLEMVDASDSCEILFGAAKKRIALLDIRISLTGSHMTGRKAGTPIQSILK